MRHNTVAIALATFAMAFASAEAQYRSAAAFDVTLGGHQVNGGLIDSRAGMFVDALLTARVHSMTKRSIVVGSSLGGVVGGFTEDCLLTPTGGCAAKANFVTFDALVGIDQPIKAMSARVLAGPSYYTGADGHSVGLQGRFDLTTPTLGHIALGAMGRATILPSHNHQSLVAYAAGISLAFR